MGMDYTIHLSKAILPQSKDEKMNVQENSKTVTQLILHFIIILLQ